jgi:hypothetical protein
MNRALKNLWSPRITRWSERWPVRNLNVYFFRRVNSASSGQQSEPCRVFTEKVVNDRCVFEASRHDRRGNSPETPPSFCRGIICKYQSLTKFRRFSAFLDETKEISTQIGWLFLSPDPTIKIGFMLNFLGKPAFRRVLVELLTNLDSDYRLQSMINGQSSYVLLQ